MSNCKGALADFKKKNNPKRVKTKRKRGSVSEETVEKKKKVTKESEKSDQTPTIADSQSTRKESASVQNDSASSLKEESIKQAKPELIKEETNLVPEEAVVEPKKNDVVSTECGSHLKQVSFETNKTVIKQTMAVKEALVQGTVSPEQGMTQATSKLENTNSTSEADVQKSKKIVLKPKLSEANGGWFR